jgi:carbamoyltransferase
MYILGLTTMTESAAVLLRDGQVVAAAEEERFSRVKHSGGFPYRSVRFVLESQGITLEDVDHVAVYWDPYKLGTRARYMIETLLRDPKLFLAKARRLTAIWPGNVGESSGWGSLFRVGKNLERHFGQRPPRIHYLDHHACHMASTFFGSGWDQSAILVMDGAGEAACTTSGAGDGTRLKTFHQHLVPHSLGHFYSSVTGFLGFQMLDGEYKMMGLSPYGDPAGARWIRDHFLQTPQPGRYRLQPGVLDYHRALKGNFEGEFQRHFGPPRERSETAEFTDRHADIAASAQRAFEEVVLDLAADLRRTTGMSRLAIAGGCGLNCTANGKILAEGIFDEIYVPPVPHDPGGALGAAMLLHVRLTGERPAPVQHAQFGPAFDDGDLAAALARRSDVSAEKLPMDEVIERAASALASGEVLSWMQGPMEYGPRALGNRSFLASPLNDGIRDVINEKIKKRELFRPFAPSVKEERASEYFEIEQSAPFMTIVVKVRPEKRATIPAVTHTDGTARPQTVAREVNPYYWQLLDEFEKRTGVPVLLNTSFNIQEPIVCTPDEALATFARSGVDALVLGSHWVTRVAARIEGEAPAPAEVAYDA